MQQRRRVLFGAMQLPLRAKEHGSTSKTGRGSWENKTKKRQIRKVIFMHPVVLSSLSTSARSHATEPSDRNEHTYRTRFPDGPER